MKRYLIVSLLLLEILLVSCKQRNSSSRAKSENEVSTPSGSVNVLASCVENYSNIRSYDLQAYHGILTVIETRNGFEQNWQTFDLAPMSPFAVGFPQPPIRQCQDREVSISLFRDYARINGTNYRVVEMTGPDNLPFGCVTSNAPHVELQYGSDELWVSSQPGRADRQEFSVYRSDRFFKPDSTPTIECSGTDARGVGRTAKYWEAEGFLQVDIGRYFIVRALRYR